MLYNKVTLLLSLCVLSDAAPILIKRQGAGVGAGCDSIFSDTDTATGQIGAQAGQWIENNGARRMKRQGAGVGAGCDSIFSDTDTATGQIGAQAGQFIENHGARKRQLNNVGGKGIGDVISGAPGGQLQQAGQNFYNEANTVDGDGTDGSADLGEAVGTFELQAGNSVTETAFGTTDNDGAGNSKKKRQLNNVSKGLGDVVSGVPGGQFENTGNEIYNEGNTVDGNGTNGAADLGESVGNFELNAGNAVTETAFGTTDNDGGSDGSNNGGGSPPPPPPPPPGPQ